MEFPLHEINQGVTRLLVKDSKQKHSTQYGHCGIKLPLPTKQNMTPKSWRAPVNIPGSIVEMYLLLLQESEKKKHVPSYAENVLISHLQAKKDYMLKAEDI